MQSLWSYVTSLRQRKPNVLTLRAEVAFDLFVYTAKNGSTSDEGRVGGLFLDRSCKRIQNMQWGKRSPLASAATFIHKLCLWEVDLIERTAWLYNTAKAIHNCGTYMRRRILGILVHWCSHFTYVCLCAWVGGGHADAERLRERKSSCANVTQSHCSVNLIYCGHSLRQRLSH